MTFSARGFFAASCAQDTEPRSETLRLDDSRCTPCHVSHYGAAADAGNVIQIGEAVAIRMRSKVRKSARVEAVRLIAECIRDRISRVELAILFDTDEKGVSKMLRGETPFPAEDFVLFAVRRADLAIEVVVAYVRFVVEKAVDGASADRTLDTIIDRLEVIREERKSKKPS